MSVLLDEDTVVLNALDFELPCAIETDHAAEIALTCRGCGQASLICRRDLRVFREWLRARARDVVTCKACGLFGVELDDIAAEVPL